MYEGRPLVVIVGNSDTGRTPIAAEFLRRLLGTRAAVQTAGVLSHEGESAVTEAQLAMEQWGIDLSTHRSQSLHSTQRHTAEVLLAIDRGTALVLHRDLPNDPRVLCLSLLADMPDVADPHRMPVGVWVATAQQLHDQLEHALPALERQLGIEPVLAAEAQPTTMSAAPQSAVPATSVAHGGVESGAATPRADHLARIVRLPLTAETLPEIVDWDRLRQELNTELHALVLQRTEPHDLTPAAALMLSGVLAHWAIQPDPQTLRRLRQASERLVAPLDAQALGELGSALTDA